MILLLYLVFVGIVRTRHVSAEQQGLQLIPVTYVVFPTTTYNNADSEQHTNCTTTTMNSYTLLLCGGRSALSNDIKGNINTKDGLQTNELQKFFIWNASDLDTVPFVSIVFEERTMPHSVDLYFHSSKTLNIDAPKITLYWSNKSPLDSENVLPLQRMAYFVSNGMYKYKVILDTNDTAPFYYLKIKMELTGSWIFLSEIKVYAEETEVDCCDPGTPYNGNSNFADTREGSVVTYTCNDGFRLRGSDTQICELTPGGAFWRPDRPECSPIFCGNPGTPANGSTTVTSDTIGSIAEHFCDEGFNLVGASRRECLVNGSWSDQLPTCGDTVFDEDVSQPISVENGVMRVRIGSTAYIVDGFTVQIVCNATSLVNELSVTISWYRNGEHDQKKKN